MDTSATNPLQNIKEDIHNVIQSREFESMEELQDVLNAHTAQVNYAPSEDFHGLSAEQMHNFLYLPFESPELITFPEQLSTEPDTKVAFLLSLMVEEIGEKGVKLTATGNLGRKFCQDVGARYFERYPDNYFASYQKITSETKMEPLHVIRLSARAVGLIRKVKGEMFLTKKCKKALDNDGMKELYPMLFKGYCQKFNWAYRDGYEELSIIQQSFPFLLFLLHKYGTTWRPASFYSDIFLNAFPMALGEISPVSYVEPEESLQNCFVVRSLERFADFFGIAELERISSDPFKEKFRIRATALLDEMIHFHF